MQQKSKTFVGFGFGAIQAGLFLQEAYRSGCFKRLVVADVMPELVADIRAAGGSFRVNVALPNAVETREITGVEIFNSKVDSDRNALIEAVAEADELATALPSVAFYGAGEPGSVVDIICKGLRHPKRGQQRSILYAAENHNHAAEILHQALLNHLGKDDESLLARFACLNTVIGKMSGVVTDERQIDEQKLARMAGNTGRCFLVESFCRILITRAPWPDFNRGISVFEEKDDLLPFEEAKLYGHNATHALLGYLARLRGCRYMDEIRHQPDLLQIGREAFINESGAALRKKYADTDPLFTTSGYAEYALDLLERMLNPHLRDAVERVTRDPRRKLGWDDRLVGTMRLALRYNVPPIRYALGAAAALKMLEQSEPALSASLPGSLWAGAVDSTELTAVANAIRDAANNLPSK